MSLIGTDREGKGKKKNEEKRLEAFPPQPSFSSLPSSGLIRLIHVFINFFFYLSLIRVHLHV
jgi:hypothetical protein